MGPINVTFASHILRFNGPFVNTFYVNKDLISSIYMIGDF